jgi:tRNA threonylcarbamoyladenosine biosynthesis protein TsaB
MKLLACDSSTDVCSVCIAEDRRVVAEYVSRSSLTHTERLMPAIELLFSHIGWKVSDLNGLAVINGPGSFTGLRIALSIVKGFAFALDLPVVQASALDVAAVQTPDDGLICPAMDARRKEIFTALYERKQGTISQIIAQKSILPQTWRNELPDQPIVFCGPGASLYFPQIKNHDGSTLAFSDFVLARSLALQAFDLFERGHGIRGDELAAAYLRPSDAETKGPRPRKVPERIPPS